MTNAISKRLVGLGGALAMLATLAGCQDKAGEGTELELTAANCPEGFGWAEGLGAYLDPDAKMDVNTSAEADDCLFNQWSWETFIWATAEVGEDNAPRFLGWKTPDDLIPTKGEAPRTPGLLRLDGHMKPLHMPGVANRDGAIVEADGSMLIGRNGYPVYASVHMTDGFFATVQRNLIATGAYENNPDQDDYFSVGDAVVKATWYRLDEGEAAPEGAYTTQAEVPVLTKSCVDDVCKAVTTGQFTTVTVALVGMHVVGYTENHPEFLWATFEHKMNAPTFADDSFVFDASASNPDNFTFYDANTPMGSDTLLVRTNTSGGAVVTYDVATGKFSPMTQVVQMNRTGGDTQEDGPANITTLNQVSQAELESVKPGTPFQNYNLIGTTWFKPNTYVTSTEGWQDLGSTNAIGAISLMNSTAETFLQSAKGKQGNNCFECHNAGSFSYSGIQPAPLKARRVAISHMIATGSVYDVPNSLPVKQDSGE